ncbi:MAG: redoxin domain-containing protein [Alphaproteobacteria bacterium]|nr:redoxin domain-containing protein [Alphaproteobacteria bacterium]
MAKSKQARQQLTLGDRAPNVFLPDQRDITISLHDKARGGPIFVLLYPTQKDPGCAAELDSLFSLAPQMLADGVHLFAIGGDPVARVQKLAAEHQPDFFLLADSEHKGVDGFGARGKLVGFVLDPGQRIQAVITPGDTPIAERAAAALVSLPRHAPFNPGVHPPLLVIPQALPREFCTYLIEQFEARGNEASGTLRMTDGKMVHASDSDIKQRRDHHVVDDDLLEQIADYMQRRVLPEIHRAFHCPIKFVEEFKIVRYDADPGGYFRPHRDNTSPGTAHRRFAMTLNLNAEDYDGGELCFPEFNNATYKPATGEAVIFSCNLLHEATDVAAGQRYVLLSFMYDEPGRQTLEQYQQGMKQR